MKRVLRESHPTVRLQEATLKRLQEDVDRLQNQISDIITQALQTKLILERLAQGDTDVSYYTQSVLNPTQ